ncbi:MAG: hypothetical protein NVS1B14_09490 [Vulcanimicrobiaceae bacterium]
MPNTVRDERSLGELIGEMTREVTEIALAKVEVRESAHRASKAGAMFGIMGVVALQAVTLISFAVAWALASVMPWGAAFLLAGLLFAGGAFVLLQRAKQEMKKLKPLPEQTIETLKEDARWAKAQMS